MNKREYLLPDIDPALCDWASERQRSTTQIFTVQLKQPEASGIMSITEIPMSATPIPLDSHDSDIALYTRDEPGPGGAHHHYTASVMGEPKPAIDEHGIPYTKRTPVQHTEIMFQKGGKVEAGPNGITNEVLLEIVHHRLTCFQKGPLPSKENAAALAHIGDAIMWLERRTKKRKARNVEGKSVK